MNILWILFIMTCCQYMSIQLLDKENKDFQKHKNGLKNYITMVMVWGCLMLFVSIFQWAFGDLA
ncbi:MAG: hypothetical protein II843_02890 [Alphaproteobacteria bacterium]|nr:hypothetical protein [Alphaproteobacteria bacterium]